MHDTPAPVSPLGARTSSQAQEEENHTVSNTEEPADSPTTETIEVSENEETENVDETPVAVVPPRKRRAPIRRDKRTRVERETYDDGWKPRDEDIVRTRSGRVSRPPARININEKVSGDYKGADADEDSRDEALFEFMKSKCSGRGRISDEIYDEVKGVDDVDDGISLSEGAGDEGDGDDDDDVQSTLVELIADDEEGHSAITKYDDNDEYQASSMADDDDSDTSSLQADVVESDCESDASDESVPQQEAEPSRTCCVNTCTTSCEAPCTDCSPPCTDDCTDKCCVNDDWVDLNKETASVFGATSNEDA